LENVAAVLDAADLERSRSLGDPPVLGAEDEKDR
jgi:hypothetical protein